MTTNAAQVFVAGSGRFLPQTTVNNFELYEMDSIRSAFDVEAARASLRDIEDAAQVFDHWSVQVTGIQKRRIMDPDIDESAERMCAEAARLALSDAGMQASDLDFLLVASLTERDVVPNAACTVGDLLGIPSAPGFVLNAACAGFVYGLAAGYAFVASGSARNVLVVSGDFLTGIRRPSCSETAPVRSY